MKRLILTLGSVLVLFALISAAIIPNVKLDLTSKGIPVIVDAPDGAIIEEGILNNLELNGIITHSWEVNKGDFSLEISMDDDDLWQTPKEYVGGSKEIFENDETFVEYVLQDENGFITKMDYGGQPEYELYYLLVKNNRAIEFAIGLETINYSLENVQKMYNAAKTAK